MCVCSRCRTVRPSLTSIEFRSIVFASLLPEGDCMVGSPTQRRPRLRLRELLWSSHGDDLPPGQRAVSDFPRFSRKPLQPVPVVPANPAVRIAGEVANPSDVPIGDLQRLPREERIADLNCVTTWCVRGLRWGGVPFRTFYKDIVVARCQPASDVCWMRIVGLDGGSAIVALEDALSDDVLLADSLNGEPLTLVHGAPIRFVSPAQYAYKSVKHLVRIELSVEQPASFGTNEHPRARVVLEERHPRQAAWRVRGPSRLVAPMIAFLAQRSARRPARQTPDG
jgi:DMSO/TMAO reductase YedYZ molybdopterin-dependent catalytic subunit